MRNCGGLVKRTLSLCFAWKQDYRALLPPSPSMPSAYVRGRLHQALYYAGNPVCGTVSVVLESPSDGTGLVKFGVNTSEGAARALAEITLESEPLSAPARLRALERLEGTLKHNKELLASAEALGTGVCVCEARRSVEMATDIVGTCAERLRGHWCHVGRSGSSDVGELLHSFGCNCENMSGHHCGRTAAEEPLVALCYTAATYPLQRGVEAITAALVRGCIPVWLPSLEAPLSALWLMHLLHRSVTSGLSELEGCKVSASNKGGDGDVIRCGAEPINIILYRGEQLGLLYGGSAEREGCKMPVMLGLTNGFTEGQTRRLFACSTGHQAAVGDGGASPACIWHHRVVKPAAAIVEPDPEGARSSPFSSLSTSSAIMGTPTDSVSLRTNRIAGSCFHHAFCCHGKTLQSLHVVFIPLDDVPLVLLRLKQCIQQARIGHSLDGSVELGPLPSLRHLNAMKETIECAISSGDGVRFHQVCGGFELTMPSGFFFLPCVLYVSVVKGAPGAVSSLVQTVQKLRTELDELGGGPLCVVCAYDPLQQLDELRAWRRAASNFVVHDWS